MENDSGLLESIVWIELDRSASAIQRDEGEQRDYEFLTATSNYVRDLAFDDQSYLEFYCDHAQESIQNLRHALRPNGKVWLLNCATGLSLAALNPTLSAYWFAGCGVTTLAWHSFMGARLDSYGQAISYYKMNSSDDKVLEEMSELKPAIHEHLTVFSNS